MLSRLKFRNKENYAVTTELKLRNTDKYVVKTKVSQYG
jgi:hypothetical protein